MAIRQRRREAHAAYDQAETLITLATTQGFGLWEAMGMVLRGWALVTLGYGEEGLAQICSEESCC